tara:strand:- start:445 stop:567 length:123 start_codon:yes stop_codon:yes gene_type:complete
MIKFYTMADLLNVVQNSDDYLDAYVKACIQELEDREKLAQ